MPTIETQSDGTQQIRADEFSKQLETFTRNRAITRGQHGHFDDYVAAQFGLYQILQGLTFTSVDLVELAQTGKLEARAFEFNSVYLDFPDADVSDPDTPTVTITQGEASIYESHTALTSARILDDTLGVYGEDTVVQKLYESTHSFALMIFTANKDDRSAVRKRIVEVFGVEPDSDRTGRRLSLPWYFDQPVRYNLKSVSYPDSGTTATRNHWPIEVVIEADMTVVQLIAAPPFMRVKLPVGVTG